MKQCLQDVGPHASLYRDSDTGIAWVEDRSTGMGHCPHPSIDSTGSVTGMKARGYWEKADRTVECNGFIYNIDHSVVDGDYDRIAAAHCQCGGRHPNPS